MMSLEFATQLLNAIISHENADQSNLALQLVSDPSTDETHICFSHLCKNNKSDSVDKNLKKSALFICYNHQPLYCFNFNTEQSLSLLFNGSIDLDDGRFNTGWIKTLIQHVHSETTLHLSRELIRSAILSLSVNFLDGEPTIVLTFAKHSVYLGKNIFFSLHFDMAFKLKHVRFDCPSHQDKYQQKTLTRFNHENQFLAFQLLLSYYSYPQVHAHLDELIDVSNDLTDDNLADYAHLANMLLI